MVGGFFPTPYPDECLYSILCRYYVRSGLTYETVSKILFGKKQSFKAAVYLPLSITCVDDWCSPSSGITRSTIAANHTLYPYWVVAYPAHIRAKIDNVINSEKFIEGNSYIGFNRNLSSRVKYLRYCTLCVADDIKMYGETYWHRQHQLAEMIYCVKHEVRLIDSCAPLNEASFKCTPASSAINTDFVAYTPDNLAPYKDKLLKIGRECEWLIVHGLNIDWSVNGYEKYRRLLRDKGMASVKGYCNDHNALDKSFFGYWGKDFLDALFDLISVPHFESWYHKFGQTYVRGFTPLYHILVMCWLAGSVGDFIESNPAETPFGHPPFVCENPICSHYHVDGAEIVDTVDYGQGLTAYFKCSRCSMLYKLKKSTDSREQRVIVDYGHQWDSELRRCCKDPKITTEQTAEILKCSYSVVQLQKQKRGLLVSTALYDIEMDPMEYYKTKVTEVCEQYDEVTIALLDEKVPGAYTYLQKRDYDWIRSRVVFENERLFRLERENLLLARLREIIATFEADGYPDEQLSYGLIANLIGSTRDELRYRMSPNSELRSLLDETVEHRKTWKQDRITRTAEHFSKRERLLLSRLHEIIAKFDAEGYPDKQLSYDFLANLIGSSRTELRNKMLRNSELQGFLDTIVEHRGVWRQERIERLGGCCSKREITLQSVIEQISANPPEQQISYKYIAKMAGLKKDVLRDSPNLLELADGIVESKDDWLKRRFIAAYHSKPISDRPYSVRDVCKVASFDIATYNKHRKVFEKILETLYAQIINQKGDTPKDE